jgi:hypothetical protein
MTALMGVRRLLLLAFFAYVVMDLGCPLVPGAFSFDVADSVEAVSAHRMRAPAVPRVVSMPVRAPLMPPLAQDLPHASDVRPLRSPIAWQPHAGFDHIPAAEPRPSLEDD